MNKSPTLLTEDINLANTDFSNLNIVNINERCFINDITFKQFLSESNIDDLENAKKYIQNLYNIELSLFSELSNNDDNILYESMILIESLNPYQVSKVSQGPSLLQNFIDQAGSFIKHQKYDNIHELEKAIDRCNTILHNIDEEKIKSKNKEKTSAWKFSTMFIIDIAWRIFSIFFLPKVLDKIGGKIRTSILPHNVNELFKFMKSSPKIGKFSSVVAKTDKVVTTIANGYDFVFTIPSDVYNLYLSFSDYDKLLSKYESKISDIKSDLIKQKNELERLKERHAMVSFTEDTTSPDVSKVYYQTPEDLRINSGKPDVVHDDGGEKMEIPNPLPQEDNKEDISSSAEFTPIDAINQVKANPANISIAKYNNLYYIDYNDLNTYMQACNIDDYDQAIDCILKAHEGIITNDTLRVIMGKQDLLKISEIAKCNMESSNVHFEIYQ